MARDLFPPWSALVFLLLTSTTRAMSDARPPPPPASDVALQLQQLLAMGKARGDRRRTQALPEGGGEDLAGLSSFATGGLSLDPRMPSGLMMGGHDSMMGDGGEGGGGRGSMGGGLPIGGLTEKVEGCFDRFDSEYMVELGRANINNKRCQAICTDRGYALAATGLLDRCFCGNDYPDIYRRVDTSLCDSPCNPDKVSCFLFTCCGSKDGRLLTVSWSGEVDIMLRLLRQLSHDYRFNNPTFRSQIDGGFRDQTALQVVATAGDHQEGVEGRQGAVRQPSNQPLYLGMGDGCPVGWKLFDRWCYKTKWAQATTYPAAVKLCQEEDAELVTVTSEAENAFVREQLGGCQGWLGLKVMRSSNPHSMPSVMGSSAPPSQGFKDSAGHREGRDGAPTHPTGQSEPSTALVMDPEPLQYTNWNEADDGASREGHLCTSMDSNGAWATVASCYTTTEAGGGGGGGGLHDFVCEKEWSPGSGCSSTSWRVAGSSCYTAVHDSRPLLDWDNARAICRELGGHLVAITSPQENSLVQELLHGVPGYIGLYKDARFEGADATNPWQWDIYTNFMRGHREPYSSEAPSLLQLAGGRALDAEEPWPSSSQAMCMVMEAMSGQWQAVGCDTSYPAQPVLVMCEQSLTGMGFNVTDCKDESGEWRCSIFANNCYRAQLLPPLSASNVSSHQGTWRQAADLCAGLEGGRLPTIRSGEHNQWLRHQALEMLASMEMLHAASAWVCLGLNNLMHGAKFTWGFYENFDKEDGGWSSSLASLGGWDSREGSEYACTQMSRHGQWVHAPCEEQQASCFVCKKGRAAAFISLRPKYEEWDIEVIEQPQGDQLHRPPGCKCPDCFRAFLRHSLTGLYLAVDSQNLVYMTHARDPAWSAFVLVAHPESGAVAVVTPHGDAALRWGHGGGRGRGWLSGGGGDGAYHGVHCAPLADGWDIVSAPPGTRLMGDHHHGGGRRGATMNYEPLPIFEESDLVLLHPTQTLRPLAERYLRISVVAQSRDLNEPGVRKCSIAVYDTTPETLSYECHLRAPGPTDNNLVYFSQEGLLFFNPSPYREARVPLPNGRITCLNGARQSAFCVFSYGEGLSMVRRLRIQWGYSIFDESAVLITETLSQSARFPVPPRQSPSASSSPASTPSSRPSTSPGPAGGGAGLPGGNTGGTGSNTEAASGGPGGSGAGAGGPSGGGSTARAPVPSPSASRTNSITLRATETAAFQNTLRVAYNNFYQWTAYQNYVETRTWQLGQTVPIDTSTSFQYWLEREYLIYRWRSQFLAQGGFELSVLGTSVGPPHKSLGDLSHFRDLLFYLFGTYEFPTEAELIMTAKERFSQEYVGLPIPQTSQGDVVGYGVLPGKGRRGR